MWVHQVERMLTSLRLVQWYCHRGTVRHHSALHMRDVMSTLWKASTSSCNHIIAATETRSRCDCNYHVKVHRGEALVVAMVPPAILGAT
jgi:hypothetical protein